MIKVQVFGRDEQVILVGGETPSGGAGLVLQVALREVDLLVSTHREQAVDGADGGA